MRTIKIFLTLAITLSGSAAFADGIASSDELGKLRAGAKISVSESVAAISDAAKAERPAGQPAQAPAAALGPEASISLDDKAEIDAILAAQKSTAPAPQQ